MEKISLEQRIQILEDKEATRGITYCYASYVNQGWNEIQINPSALSDIFTENPIWGSTIMNISVSGVQNSIERLKKKTKCVMFAMHSYSNPIIIIEGNIAKGNWLFWVADKSRCCIFRPRSF